MKEKIKNVRELKEILFLVALAPAILVSMLIRTFYAVYCIPYMGKIYLFSWGILGMIELLTFINDRYQLKEWLGAILFGSIFLLFMRWGGSAAEMATFLPFAYVARNIDFKKIARFLAIWQGVIILFIVFSSIGGVIENSLYANYDEFGQIQEGGRINYSLGFLVHFYLGFYILNWTMMVLYCLQGKLRNWQAQILLGISLVTFIFTHGRYAFIITSGVILIIWSLRVTSLEGIKNKIHKTSIIMVFIYPISVFVSYAVTFLYDANNVNWVKVNQVLGDRIVYANQGLKEWGITWFGQKIDMIGIGLTVEGGKAEGMYNWVDNAWMNVTFHYGIFVCMGLILLYSMAVFSFWTRKQYVMLILFLFLAIQMLVDDCGLIFSFNGLVFSLGYFFCKREKIT